MDLVCTVSEPPKIGFDNEASKFITAELLPLPKETLDDHRLLAPNAPSAVRLGAKYPAMCDCPAIFGSEYKRYYARNPPNRYHGASWFGGCP